MLPLRRRPPPPDFWRAATVPVGSRRALGDPRERQLRRRCPAWLCPAKHSPQEKQTSSLPHGNLLGDFFPISPLRTGHWKWRPQRMAYPAHSLFRPTNETDSLSFFPYRILSIHCPEDEVPPLLFFFIINLRRGSTKPLQQGRAPFAFFFFSLEASSGSGIVDGRTSSRSVLTVSMFFFCSGTPAIRVFFQVSNFRDFDSVRIRCCSHGSMVTHPLVSLPLSYPIFPYYSRRKGDDGQRGRFLSFLP